MGKDISNQMASELDRTRLDARTRALLEGPIPSTLLRLLRRAYAVIRD